jgi:predicted CXXCH cytochrome family protein
MKQFSLLFNLVKCLLLLGLLCSCDAVNRHKVLTTIFDGVPSLPPPEQLCADYVEQQRTEALAGVSATSTPGEEPAQQRSQHLPYQEKRCDDCHDKGSRSGLVRPLQELCLGCHLDFIQGAYVHGPVAVNDCLACHEPHSASQPALLKHARNELCSTCHQEARLAAKMHTQVAKNNMGCLDCHNPHFGNSPLFLD